MRTTPLLIAFVLLAAPLTAHAEESCDGWFCDEPSKLSGESVAVNLQDGTVVKGVVVEIAPDHLTVGVGDARVVIKWSQIIAIQVNPKDPPPVAKTPPPDPEPEQDAEPEVEPAKDPVVVIAEKPASPKPPLLLDEPDEKPLPPPVSEPGMFTFGARAKLLAAVEDARFHQGSERLTDYATGGVGFELALSLRMTRMLFLRGSYEHAELFRGEKNSSVNTLPTSDAIGIGLRGLFGDEPSAHGVFEIGIGYRWLNVPYADGAAPDGSPRRPGYGMATYEGVESLRAAIGAAFNVDDHGRLEVLLEGSFGQFAHVRDDNADKTMREIPGGARTTHGFVGLAIGLELGP